MPLAEDSEELASLRAKFASEAIGAFDKPTDIHLSTIPSLNMPLVDHTTGASYLA